MKEKEKRDVKMTLFQDVFFFLPKDLRSEEVNPNIRSLSASNFHMIFLLSLADFLSDFLSILSLTFYSLSFSLILFLDLRSGRKERKKKMMRNRILKGRQVCAFVSVCTDVCKGACSYFSLSFFFFSFSSSFFSYFLFGKKRKEKMRKERKE